MSSAKKDKVGSSKAEPRLQTDSSDSSHSEQKAVSLYVSALSGFSAKVLSAISSLSPSIYCSVLHLLSLSSQAMENAV